MNARFPNNTPKTIYYIWKLFQWAGGFTFHEFKRFFCVPTNSLSDNFRLTTRYRINSMGLWCAVGIAIIHLIYYIVIVSDPNNLPDFDIQLEGEGAIIALQNFNYRIAKQLQELGFHLINSILFTLFLILWLYIHYVYEHLSPKITLLLCIIYLIGNNLESLSNPSTSFANVWLIMTPIIIIPSVGNRYSLPLLAINLLLHHLFSGYEPTPYDILLSIASFFVSIFIMMMQMEYYRREVQLHDSASRLREHALEIELIKENMNSGLMLLNLDLKVRPNFNDMCLKLLHKRNLHNEYFPTLLRNIVAESQYLIHSMNNYNDPEGDDYAVGNLDEWEERIKHYFEMLKTEQLDDDELSYIDPLKFIKIYSYEGRSYISFHISTIKVHDQIQYFMVIISNDTGKVAGRYRIKEHERKHLERAQLLLALSHENPTKQLQSLHNFAKSYLELCQSILTEVRSKIPPKQFLTIVSQQLVIMQKIFGTLSLNKYREQSAELLKEYQEFSPIDPEHSSNMMLIDKSTQTRYTQLIINSERFLHEIRSLFSIATFFIREPTLAVELQKQKQALRHSPNMLQGEPDMDFYDTQLSPESQMFINLYTAFEMLLGQQDLQHDLDLVEQSFSSQSPNKPQANVNSSEDSPT